MPEMPSRKPNGPRGEPTPPVKFNRTLTAWVVFIGMALLLMLFAFRGMHRREQISANQFWTYLENGQVAEVTLGFALGLA